MITRFITKLLGDPNEKAIRECQKTLDQVKQREQDFNGLAEADIKIKTAEFKERLQKGETVDDLLPEAFAVHKQACKLLVGQKFQVRSHEMGWDMVPYDVQLVGGIVLHRGKIAEMKTGEGKTLVATLPLYLNALEGKGAFLVTVNDYLALRDSEWMGFLFRFLGLSVGVIAHGQSQQERKQAYAADITYGTNNEFGFDYLRDNMAIEPDARVQRALHYAIVDEVDSILIDEARTPLIISAPAEESTEKYQKYARLVTQLKLEEHYKVDEKAKAALLTDEGVKKMENLLGMQDIYTEAGATEVHHIEQALKAQTIFRKDVEYMVQDGEVVIIDEFTGRLMPGRRFSEGLHQAIEAKEGVDIRQESRTLATITFQNYFRLFKKLAGMTGTAMTEAEEFLSIYGLETVAIPTNVVVARKDLNDLVYKSAYGKFQAVTKKVKELQEKGQPVLVGTISVEKSELLSQMFQQAGVQHHVLNAKQHQQEAEIVANAGQKGAVTIATNMAGRGTDIKLGSGVRELDGLYILGTERHEARRIDNQLRGRSGRQGDPGASQFFVSMEDELMRLFGGDRMKSIMETLKVPEDMPIENGFISRSIESAQKKVEGHNFDIRKHLVQYDDVMNKHRMIIYRRRAEILENENIHEKILGVAQSVARQMVDAAAPSKHREDWNLDVLKETLQTLTGRDPQEYRMRVDGSHDREELGDFVKSYINNTFLKRKDAVPEDGMFFDIEKKVALRTIDRLWMDHIDAMMKLRSQVSLQAYGQKDPLIEYKKEAFQMLEQLVSDIDMNTLQTLMRMEFRVQMPREQIQTKTNEDEIVDIETGSREMLPKPVEVESHAENSAKVGRNDPCPCGSEKKYKKCHGR